MAMNYMGHRYRDMRLDEDLPLTNFQAIVFIILNFTMALILIVAVNCNMDIACGLEMKQWLIVFAMILGLGSLVSVVGLDIDRQPRLKRQMYTAF